MRLWLIVVLLLTGAFVAAFLPPTVLESVRMRDRSWIVHGDLNNVVSMLLLAAAVLIFLSRLLGSGLRAW